MSRLRIAVIGAGHLGRIHAKLLQQVDGVELVAVTDPFEQARVNAKAMFGVPTFADYRQCIGTIDAAIVAAPTDLHGEIATELLTAGKHAFVEKPLAANGPDAQRLANLAKSRHLTLQVGHVERFNPAFAALGDLAVDAKYIEAVRASHFPGRCLDVGVVMDLMIHDLDLVLSLTHSPIRSISASGMSVISSHEDIAETRIEFECGLIANLKASRLSPTPARQMQIFGANGFADIDFGKPSLTSVCPSEAVVQRRFDLDSEVENPLGCADQIFSESLKCVTKDLEPRNAILDELHDFAISIQTGVEPAVDGQAGARVVGVADQILESIKTRRWYLDSTTTETGPHAMVRQRIESRNRAANPGKRAA